VSVLKIDKAKYPDGAVATAQSGGILDPSTTYYYRVAAVTDVGETCACASFSGYTTVADKTLGLTWNAVAGIKATGGYKIYRNTVDSWDAGNLFLVAVDTNSYVDDGSVSPTTGVPVTFVSDNIVATPEDVQSLLAETNIPGKEGGDVQYLGSPPKRLAVQGILKGSSAKADLDQLRALRAGGVACQVTISAFGQTWLQAYYLVAGLVWMLLAGTVNVAEGAVLQFTVQLVSGEN